MELVRRLHPNDFQWRGSTSADGKQSFSLDRLTGTTRIRQAIETGKLEELLAEWDRDSARFQAMAKPFYLY
jgi:uncharacterized protein YbbC (DUF1343 family)